MIPHGCPSEQIVRRVALSSLCKEPHRLYCLLQALGSLQSCVVLLMQVYYQGWYFCSSSPTGMAITHKSPLLQTKDITQLV